MCVYQKLTYGQKDISKEGHAIEARIYAEDPVTFFPSPGTITNLEIPNGPGIRHELGVETNSTVAAWLLGLGAYQDGLLIYVLLILSAMPPAVMSLVPAQLYKLDIELANANWIVSTSMLLVVLPKLSFGYYDNNKTGHSISRLTKDLEEISPSIISGSR